MECGFKEKVIMYFYSESTIKDDIIEKHIKECDGCRKLYYTLYIMESSINSNGFIYNRIEDSILKYARAGVRKVSFKFSNILLPLVFSFGVLLLFLLPKKTVTLTNNIDLEISNLESNMSLISYESEVYDTDYGF